MTVNVFDNDHLDVSLTGRQEGVQLRSYNIGEWHLTMLGHVGTELRVCFMTTIRNNTLDVLLYDQMIWLVDGNRRNSSKR